MMSSTAVKTDCEQTNMRLFAQRHRFKIVTGGDVMKKLIFQLICSVLLGLFLPWIVFAIHNERECAPLPQDTVTSPQEQLLPTVIRVIMDGQVTQLPLEEYLVGVVLREMPVDFEPEAQKAQAVVARTYALRTCEKGTKHQGLGGVCTDSACCQAYIDPQDYLSAGGSLDAVEKVSRAVEETAGQVLTYKGKLIDATYFSCSGGMTENAAAVWGSDIPYLQATESPGEEGATHYIDTVSLSAAEFQSALGISLKGNTETWIGTVRYTDGGGVDTMQIGGITYQGTTLRKKLNLRSTAFTITAVGDTVIITTKGYGHRVGMSQYGAEAMAVSGKTYDEILAHYYRGTTLEKN